MRLFVSRTTVVAAYNVLRAERVIHSRRGGGTWIAKGESRIAPPVPQFRAVVKKTDAEIDFLLGPQSSSVAAKDVFDAALNPSALQRALAQARYLPLGLPDLRVAVAERYCADGLLTTPEQILISNGSQQALDIIASLLLRRGDEVIVENPTYLGALDLFGRHGARITGLDVDADGARTDQLRELAERTLPGLVFLIPTFNNPTGVVLSQPRRKDVVQFAEARSVPVIDDRALADISLVPATPPPLAAIGDSARVLTIGSLSKVFWAGLRVGWIRASSDLISQLASFKAIADLGTSVPSQILALSVLADIDEIRERRRHEVQAALEAIGNCLQGKLPEWEWTPPKGGLSLWVRLPRGNAGEFAQVALRQGVSVLPGAATSVAGSHADFLRLQFVHDADTIVEGVRRLARAWRDYDRTAGVDVVV